MKYPVFDYLNQQSFVQNLLIFIGFCAYMFLLYCQKKKNLYQISKIMILGFKCNSKKANNIFLKFWDPLVDGLFIVYQLLIHL